jgi:L-2,4-diaminobutyric acid acetyltransferase
MLLCDHFRDTCIFAGSNSGPAGFISGYLHPSRRDTFFVWQVAVHPRFRRKGLGIGMLKHLIRRPAFHSVSYIETTVTPSNDASRNMFYSLAGELKTHCIEEICYPAELFGKDAHEDEVLLRIGPFRLSEN